MARLKGTTELRIKEYSLKAINLTDVRKEVEGIAFDKGITVLALQPEIGKTFSFIKYCQDNADKNIAYFAPNHKLLDEVEIRLKEKLPSSNIIHWRGMGKICKLYQENDPYLNIFIDNSFDLHYYCGECEHSKGCQYKDYRKQFTITKPCIVLSPLEYIKKHVDKFDTIFVDELIIKCYTYSLPDEEELRSVISILWDFEHAPILEELRTAISNPEIFNKIDKQELWRVFQRGRRKSLPDLKKIELLGKVFNNIYDSVEFLKWKSIYEKSDGYEKSLKTYYEPFIYKLFELAETKPIVFMDATFSQELFEDLLQGYDGEFGIKNNFDVNIYYTNVKNKNSVVYRVNPTSWYPKSSITTNIITDAKKLYNSYNILNKKVGLITSKDIEIQFFNGFNALHYNNLRGQNKFEDFDVLILLGTYLMNPIGIVDYHNELYLTDLSTSTKVIEFDTDGDADNYAQTKDPKYGHIKTIIDYAVVNIKDLSYLDSRRRYIRTKRQRYIDDAGESVAEPIKADLIEVINREYELYQAIYRIRPLSKPKIIYMWGIVPESVKEELQYEEIEDIDLIIRELKQELIDRCSLESYFEEDKRISAIEEAITKDTDCSRYQADKMVKEFLSKSQIWAKDKKKIPESDKPVFVAIKKNL